MMTFSSGFSCKLAAMLEYRAAHGLRPETHARNLLKFDTFCVEQFPSESTLTRDIVHAWIDSETALEHDVRICPSSADAAQILSRHTAQRRNCSLTSQKSGGRWS